MRLAAASVWLGEMQLPILSAARLPAPEGSPVTDQINAFVPFQIDRNAGLSVSVERAGLQSAPVEVILADARPGIFVAGEYVVALDQASQLVDGSNRVERGKVVQLFATGLGRVTHEPEPGQPASAAPLSLVQGEVAVLFEGIRAIPLFAGLTPGFVGLYQINVIVPESISPDNGRVAIQIEVDGARSNSVILPVL
jgi:uncharacterized protein (TIGR03437 family)